MCRLGPTFTGSTECVCVCVCVLMITVTLVCAKFWGFSKHSVSLLAP